MGLREGPDRCDVLGGCGSGSVCHSLLDHHRGMSSGCEPSLEKLLTGQFCYINYTEQVSGVQVKRCAGEEVCRCGGVQVYRCAGVQVCRCAGVQVWRCGGVEVWRCGGVEVWRCGGVQVKMYGG